MSRSILDVPTIGLVSVTKKRGQKTMRLRVTAKGEIQVSMPWILPKAQAVNFILSKRDWILEQQAETSFVPYNGMLFGRTQQLIIRENSDQSRPKQDGRYLIVHFAGTYERTNPEHVKTIQKAIMKSLRVEAEKILLPRLRELADLYGFSYKSSAIKQVVGRWGSCDSNKHIVLSIYLIQLPIEYIDYVIIHELTHTQHMNHSADFWETVAEFCPEYKVTRKKMKQLRPRIYDAKTFMA